MTRPNATISIGDDDHDDGLDQDDREMESRGSRAGRIAGAIIEPLAVDAEQAAALIGVSRSMFFKLLDAGAIGPIGVRLGKLVRYPLAELRAWAAAGMPPRHEWVARQKDDHG